MSNPELRGIHPRMPFAIYRAIDCCSSSRLRKARERSFGHMMAHLTDVPTPAMILGSAFHDLMQNPDDFKILYERAATCCAVLKSGDRKGQACGAPSKGMTDNGPACGTHGGISDPNGIIMLAPKDYDNICDSAAGALAHKFIGEIVRAAPIADRELSIFAELGGLPCKARIDGLCRAGKFAYDFKTCRCAKEGVFDWTPSYRDAVIQQAFYRQIERAAGLDVEKRYIIAVELAEPGVGINWFEVKDDDLDKADEILQPYIEQYAKCKASGVWPGYPSSGSSVSVKRWTDELVIED